MNKKDCYELRKGVLRELADGFACIHNNFKYFKRLNKHKVKITGAAEWLLDNIYLIEKEFKAVKKSMPLEYFESLPSGREYLKYVEIDSNSDEHLLCLPRIFILAKRCIQEKRKINLENMTDFILFYENSSKNQEYSDYNFTMGELWAFPLMLKTAIILELSQYTNELVKIQEYILNKSECDEEKRERRIKIDLKEETLQRNIGDYITNIRIIEGLNWKKFFESTSIVERILECDPAETYKAMDFESKDYYRHKLEEISKVVNVSETKAALNVLELAKKSKEDNEEEYKCHVGYYIIDHGTKLLSGYYHDVTEVISQGMYIALNVGLTFLLSFLFLLISTFFGLKYKIIQFIFLFLMIMIPISEIIQGIINYVTAKTVKMRMVPKLDLSKGIPEKYKTIVAVPAIVNNKEKIKELMEKLEVYYCGNTDKNIYFALLSDFTDCRKETDDNDEEIINCGLKCAEKLNKKYGKKFFFLSRKRVYNEQMNIYMGRERKRGKILEFMALLKGYSDNTFDVVSSSIEELKNAKYIITLDEDTFMPRETVYKLVGAMSHVLNIPYVNGKGRVVRGYNIMQPKVSISLESKNASLFSKIFGGDSGVDGYSTAYSDTYEDLFGEGSFVGKGIINIDQFYEITNNHIRRDRVLSHDLLEGALTRCALVTDVEFVDEYPSSYESSCKRMYRWVRGDWQLIGWLFSKKISSLNKWKIFDNMRRSLLAPNLLFLLIISFMENSIKRQAAVLSFLVLIMPFVFTITDLVVTPKNKLRGTFKTLEQILLIISFIPYESYLMIKAISVTLYRIIFTKKNLLEWQSAKLSESMTKNDLKSYIKRMWWGPFMGIITLCISWNNSIPITIVSLMPVVLWICSPYIAFYISREKKEEENKRLDKDERDYLSKLSRRIYSYYEDFINEENNYLPPDNYQERPFKGVAHRTSPTNIGMGFMAYVTAYDLGYITITEFIDKTKNMMDALKELKKFHGHYLNWYDTQTKTALNPQYISTVDNGNLIACLWILKETMKEVKKAPLIRKEEITSLNDICRIIKERNTEIEIEIEIPKNITGREYLNVLEKIFIDINSIDGSFDSETEYWLNKLFCEVSRKIEIYYEVFDNLEIVSSSQTFNFEDVPDINELLCAIRKNEKAVENKYKSVLKTVNNRFEKYLRNIDEIIDDIDNISRNMDFGFLYDEEKGLFSIGYNVEENSIGNSYYDLLASECRIASFVAICKNDIPQSHWFKLGRSMTNAFHTHSLVSWSGTMFEYFMPSLIMKNYSGTLLDETYKSVIKAQTAFAKQKKVPWGISECAFYEFDNDKNYQYKAFGVPGLGLKRGLEDEVVVSPYSTIMVIPFCIKEGIKNLKELQRGGALGRYGFIEAIDYTKAREDKFVTDYSVDNQDENVDNSVVNVDKYEYMVDKYVVNNADNIEKCIVDNVNNVDNFEEKRRKLDISMDLEDNKKHINPQKDNKCEENLSHGSYPQDCEEIYNDGIKPNKIYTYMVHHLGMSIMALNNVLKENIIINRFHKIPEVKASQLLLKEKIPSEITFERNEDYSIKKTYIKGEKIVPRVFTWNKSKSFSEQQVLLLSNGIYSSMINICGSGYSKINDMFLYRWKGNSVSDDTGMFFYIKNLNSNDYWSSTFEPCKNYGENYEARLSLDKAEFLRQDGNIETKTELIISNDENFEVRKISIKNIGDKGRSIEITSYCEITLTTLSADSVHPAFSNLFIQTEYDKEENILFGSRRGRVKNSEVPYIFQKVIADGQCEGEITYETSRINFIGRNRNLKNPEAMDNDKTLDNTVGTILDPILSMRVRIRVEEGEKREIYFITGSSDSKDSAMEMLHKYDEAYKIEKIFKNHEIGVQLELKNLGIKAFQADMFQNLSRYIFYIQGGRENRADYIKNIKKHQKDLWPYGISGDLPIILLTIENEDEINLVSIMIKFYLYLKSKGVKTDFVIYNEEEFSYDEPLQKNILQIIRADNAEENINKPGGIFVYNKSSMNEEMKEFLIGISRLYINSKDGKLLEQIDKYEKQSIEQFNYEQSLIGKYCICKDSNSSCKSLHSDLLFKEAEILDENHLKQNTSNSGADCHNKDDISPIDKSIKAKAVGCNIQYDDILNTKDSGETKINYSEYDHDIEYLQKEDIADGINKAENTESKKLKAGDNLNSKKNSHPTQSKNYVDSRKNSDIKEELAFFNGYGGFDKNDNSYVIKLSDYKTTPAPWINVISNSDFGFHISESGSAYTWCKNSRENKITPWSNDYITDPLGEALYIKDNKDGRYFSITPEPVRDKNEYVIKHGFGYSEFTHTACNIKGTMTAFVPRKKQVKLQIVKLENLLNEEREISVFYYARLVLGVYGYENERYITTYIDKTDNKDETNNKFNINDEYNINHKYHTNIRININDDEAIVGVEKDNVNNDKYSTRIEKDNVDNDKESTNMEKFNTNNDEFQISSKKINDKNKAEDKNNIVYNDDVVIQQNNIKYIGGVNPYSEYFGDMHAYLTMTGEGDSQDISFCGDSKEFIGFGNDLSEPKALKDCRLSNKTGSVYDPCLSACIKITLKPKETKEILVVLGQDSKENVRNSVDKYKDIKSAHKELENVKEYWNEFLGRIQVSTPDKTMDYMLNGWLLYETLSCRYLSRSAFYQSGGAYGFRDQLQDSMALGVADSEITKKQIIRSSSRQYEEGDVQHWWHPVVNSGIRTRFSDDLLWLPYVTAEYIKTTGDYDILNIKTPYLHDEPLREGEDERYTIVNVSSNEGTIYEHCQKAISRALKFGKHNIPLMGSGDWNDGMSTVGNKGKGESVWLGWFLYDILNSFEKIAHKINDCESSLYYKSQKEFIRKNLEENAWDGGWYRRAYFDDGTPLGSRENPECQIDSLSQSWAVISGAGKLNYEFNEDKYDEDEYDKDDENYIGKKVNENVTEKEQNNDLEYDSNKKSEEDNRYKDRCRDRNRCRKSGYTERAVEAMQAVERNLIKKDKGMILLLTPPFDNSNLEPGYIKGYVPGVRENGGQYTHAAVWVILAMTKLGYGNKAAEYYHMINPINHSKTELESRIYKTEPYVMSADVYIKEPHGGRGGWSWYTGASGWMYKVGIENILGLRKVQGKGYEINPCVPDDWNEYMIRIKNKTENYDIRIIREKKNYDFFNNDGITNDKMRNTHLISKILINGKCIEGNIIPKDKGDLSVEVYFY